MIPFKQVFTPVFFVTFGYFLIAVVGLVFAIRFRRTRGGRLSLILLLAMAIFTTYNCIQWLMNGFIPYFVSNYAAAHTNYEVPAWVNWVLEYVYLYGMNGAVAVLFALSAWAAWKDARAAKKSSVLPIPEESPVDAAAADVAADDTSVAPVSPSPESEVPPDSAREP